MEQSRDDLEVLARRLEASGMYRVLRRLPALPKSPKGMGSSTRVGVFLDVETTGLDPISDEVIEISMVSFTYTLEGEIVGVNDFFSAMQQPARPIPPEITALTGITDDMVAGAKIDLDSLRRFAGSANLIVAHNASFDRKFSERLDQVFSRIPWACSMSQVDWVSEGFSGTRLSYLLAGFGFFHDAHRASDDCHAAITILSLPLPKCGRPAFAHLLQAARRPSYRVWAMNSPYDLKDALKKRGYKWNGDENGLPRSWYIDVTADQLESEKSFLRTEIYRTDIEPLVREVTAYDRFSTRA